MPAPTETLPHPEQREVSYTPLRGIQSRFLLADQTLLDPNKTCPNEAFTQIETFQDRNYGIFERASVADRKDYWEQKNIRGEEAKRVWTEQTKTAFNRAKNTSRFQSLSPMLATLGLDINKEAFDGGDIEKVWQRYFASSEGKKAGGVRQFAKDVLDAQMTDAMDGIAWFSNLFGETGGQVVTQLIGAEVEQQANSGFAAQHKAKANSLSLEETKLLTFLYKYKDKDTAPTPARRREGGLRSLEDLPIAVKEQEILDSVRNNTYTILIAETGAGKTIGAPVILQKMFQEGQKMIITEPTRVNAAKPAGIIAKLRGEHVGGKIGYQHADKAEFSNDTDTLLMTEGLLLRRLLSDPTLKDYSYLMIDEAHVQTKDTVQIFLYLQDIQQKRAESGMPPLKVVVASATIDRKLFKDYLPGANVVDVPGRTYDINEVCATSEIRREDMPQKAAEKVREIVGSSDTGDILIAVKGQADMRLHTEALRSIPNLEVYSLHANTPKAQQDAMEAKVTPGKRKVIIATDFIQRGITLEDLVYVINTGEKFANFIDPVTGLEYIQGTKQSQAECDQWKGRVGRVGIGYCYNLFTQADKDSREKYPTPEIQRSDISDVLLLAKARGKDIHNLHLLSSPSREQIDHAISTLKLLGAFDNSENITDIGRKILQIPVDLHLARMIAEAERKDIMPNDLYVIAAMVESGNIVVRGQEQAVANAFGDPKSDFLTLLRIWKEFRQNGTRREWAVAHGLNYAGLMKAEDIYNKRLEPRRQRGSKQPTPEDIGQCVAAGYRDRVMRNNAGSATYRWDRGDVGSPIIAIDGQRSSVRVVPTMFVGENNKAIRIQPGRAIPFSLCQAVEPGWVS